MIIVFIDGTSLVARGTFLSAVPIILTLGNFPERIRNKLDASVVAGYIPQLDNKVLRRTEAFRVEKRRVVACCLEFFFAPLVDVANQGGMWVHLFGRAVLAKPIIAAFTLDGQMRSYLLNMLDSYKTH
jgi:hypothetical protein